LLWLAKALAPDDREVEVEEGAEEEQAVVGEGEGKRRGQEKGRSPWGGMRATPQRVDHHFQVVLLVTEVRRCSRECC
jgi:hypothetical protein